MRYWVVLSCIVIGLTALHGWAGEVPQTGKRAADQYFLKRKRSSNFQKRRPAYVADHYLALHLGTFVNDKAYRWGETEEREGSLTNVANLTAGVSYRIGEWIGFMDLLSRIDFITFRLEEKQIIKMSFLPVVMFPEANSRFPLYFGGGIGLGVFFDQIDDESPLSLDYQLLAGVRFFELIGNTGLTLELGMKNHVHLISDGQYKGVSVSLGTVSTF